MSGPTYHGTPPLVPAAADLEALPVLGQLQALTLEPGDILVFTCNPRQAITAGEEARMRAALAEHFPDTSVLIVFGGTLGVIRKAEGLRPPPDIAAVLAAATPQPPPLCRWFRWVGQPLTSCDGCGRPAWEHEGDYRVDSPFAKDGIGVPYSDETREAIRRKWDPTYPATPQAVTA